MYILYCCDNEFMSQVIHYAVTSIEEEHDTPGVKESLKPFLPSPDDCLHGLRIKLLILVDQDEATRRKLCEFTSPVVRNYTAVPPEKADRFYADLHDNLIPEWIKDETVTPGEFVDRVRMSYLIS
jgi:hypothetical protein